MARNGRPSAATVKRLYALSGNRCAFPRCTAPLIHEGVVTGEVCHIKAASPEGPRFDPQQTEQERNAFENLVLMCEPHHKVIDADEESYTVEQLQQIKQRHEAGQHSEPASGSADLFAAAILGSSVYGDVTNVGNLTICQGTQLAPTLEARPQLEIGFASSFFLPLQARTTLTPVIGGGGGLYLSREDTVSIRTDNRGQKSARYLSWAYTLPTRGRCLVRPRL